jgi:hypothetical protein
MFALIQIVAFIATAAYLFHAGRNLRRRSALSWDSLMARLRPDGNARELSDLCFSRHGLNSIPIEKWKHVHVLWAMYSNAGVMIEMADYAALNSDSVSLEFLADLRGEAMLMRICVLKTLASFALSAGNERIWANALRAESAWAEMEIRIIELLELGAAEIVPEFVAAM